MKHSRFRIASAKAPILAIAAGLVALFALAPSLASGSYGPEGGSGSSSGVATVYIKGGKQGLRFVAPKTIVAGEDLKVENTTDPKKVGPHTFSLVAKSLWPKTAKERQLCFTKGHICKAVAGWHGAKGNGPPKENPAKAGLEGWDTIGTLTEKGDSWFTGEKPHASIEQPVTADTSAGPTTIYFMCAIHPWMHGSIEVLPGG